LNDLEIARGDSLRIVPKSISEAKDIPQQELGCSGISGECLCSNCSETSGTRRDAIAGD
jgi:hypothetical protein